MKITLEDMDFLSESRKCLMKNPELATYRNDEDTHIALRTNGDKVRDSILVYRIDGIVAEFEGILPEERPLVLKEHETQFRY